MAPTKEDWLKEGGDNPVKVKKKEEVGTSGTGEEV